MSLLLLCLSAWVQPTWANPDEARARWSTDVRRELADPLALELALARAGLRPSDASVVFGRTTWRADDSGLVHPRGTVGWRELTGPIVVPDTTSPQTRGRRFCTQVPGHDPVPGGRELRLYRSPEVNADPMDPVSTQATLVLGTGPEGEVLFSSLRPGEQIQIIEAVPIRGGTPREHLRIDRQGRSLSITRIGTGSKVCYDDAG